MAFALLDIRMVLTFFAVFVRFSVLIAVLPFFGDKMIPTSIKILGSLVMSMALFPSLVVTGKVNPMEADVWASTAGGLIGVLGTEVLLGLVLGYTTRLAFEAISMGANLVGNFMGFAAASYYDPHQESQTEVIAQVQMTVAMLLFLACNGHHLVLAASLRSYQIVGLGKLVIEGAFARQLLTITAEVIRIGIQIAAPVAIVMFAMNLVFGVLSKALPQLNVFVLSFAVSASIGFLVLFISFPEFKEAVEFVFGRMTDWMESILVVMSGRH